MNLDLTAQQPQSLARRTVLFEHLPLPERLSHIAWNKAAFIAFWEGQGQLSSFAYIGLVAFTGIWVALAAMLVWSILATVLFCAARERGYPNLLSTMGKPSRSVGNIASYAALSVLRAWLAGVNEFLYSRCSGSLVAASHGSCKARRLARMGAITLGMTLFGVSTAEHLLRTAGYSGRRLLRMSLIGPFLHVPYRVLVSAAVVAIFTDVLDVVTL